MYLFYSLTLAHHFVNESRQSLFHSKFIHSHTHTRSIIRKTKNMYVYVKNLIYFV